MNGEAPGLKAPEKEVEDVASPQGVKRQREESDDEASDKSSEDEAPMEEDEDEDEDDESEDNSDDEVDFLAAARALDPEAIREKEREYDANMAERLAEEIPAGSSAATAGGGSGFASPASGVDKDERQRAIAALKRARTSDSMVVQGTQDSSSSESDSDDEEMSIRS